LECLRAVELDFCEGFLQSEEIKSILNGLCGLKRLERFRVAGKAYDASSTTLNDFRSFLVSIRHLKNLHVSLKGISSKAQMELWEKLLPKFPLSDNSFKSL